MVNNNFKNRPGLWRKKFFKLSYSGVFALILLAGFSISAKSQKVNFSGLWKVDSLKSNFGGLVVAVTLRIVQTTDTISIERTMRTGRGDARSFTDKLPLDGKTMTNTSGTTKGSVSIKWSGRALVETSSFHEDTHNTTYQATETWTLSPDSKTLTIDRVVANDGEGGHGTSKAVYHQE
jgi:uncharacterized protein YodC (DUF2158 family)